MREEREGGLGGETQVGSMLRDAHCSYRLMECENERADEQAMHDGWIIWNCYS